MIPERTHQLDTTFLLLQIHHVLVDLVQRVGDLERELNTLKRERAAEIAGQAGGDLKRTRN